MWSFSYFSLLKDPQHTILCRRTTCFVLIPAPTHLAASCFSAHSHLHQHSLKLSVHRAAPSVTWLSSPFVCFIWLDGYFYPKELSFSSLFHRDTPLKTRERPQNYSNRPPSPSFIFSRYGAFKMASSAARNQELVMQGCAVLRWLLNLKTSAHVCLSWPLCLPPVVP